MKLEDDCLKIHADLTHAYGAKCVLHCTVCRWTEGFRARKVSLEDGHCPSCLVLVSNEQTVLFVKKCIEENPHMIICEVCERCVLIGTAERIVGNDLNLKKIVANLISHLLTDYNRNRELNVQRTSPKYLNQMDANS